MRGLTDEEAEELRCAMLPEGLAGLAGQRSLAVLDRLERRGLTYWHAHSTDESLETASLTERGRLALRLHDIVRSGVAA